MNKDKLLEKVWFPNQVIMKVKHLYHMHLISEAKKFKIVGNITVDIRKKGSL